LRELQIAAGKLPTGYTFGNGEEMTREEAAEVHAILDEVTEIWPWQSGDLMMLDNLQVAHGRSKFSGDRETLVALLD
jgi:hypothetical protein